MDLGNVPPPLIFLPLLSWSLLLPRDLEELSQLGSEMWETIANNMWESLASVHVALHREIKRPQPLPHDPPMPLYNDAFLMSLPFDQLLRHTCMYCDAICETWRVHVLHDTN